MKAIIVAGGDAPSRKLLTKEISKNSIVIGVDSGANCLHEYNILPNYLIGDFDSIKKSTLKFFTTRKIPIDIHPKVKNATDAELALQKAHNLGATEITFLGCLGGKRVDHLLGSIGLLVDSLALKIKACIKDDYQTITLLNRKTTINGKKGEMFSLLAYCNMVTKLTIKGAKYNLNNHKLKLGSVLTLSNEFLSKPVAISFAKGKLLLFRQNEAMRAHARGFNATAKSRCSPIL